MKKFSFKIIADAFRYMGTKERWTEKPIAQDDDMPRTWRKLEEISCPECFKFFAVKSFKLRNRLGHFSKLTCKRCEKTTSSQFWQCECGDKWTKCLTHQHFPEKFKARIPRARTCKDEIGSDAPMPKRRKTNLTDLAITDDTPAPKRIRLMPGSRLAVRFPHLVG